MKLLQMTIAGAFRDALMRRRREKMFNYSQCTVTNMKPFDVNFTLSLTVTSKSGSNERSVCFFSLDGVVSDLHRNFCY